MHVQCHGMELPTPNVYIQIGANWRKNTPSSIRFITAHARAHRSVLHMCGPDNQYCACAQITHNGAYVNRRYNCSIGTPTHLRWAALPKSVICLVHCKTINRTQYKVSYSKMAKQNYASPQISAAHESVLRMHIL